MLHEIRVICAESVQPQAGSLFHLPLFVQYLLLHLLSGGVLPMCSKQRNNELFSRSSVRRLGYHVDAEVTSVGSNWCCAELLGSSLPFFSFRSSHWYHDLA